jgi:hypothetical protein
VSQHKPRIHGSPRALEVVEIIGRLTATRVSGIIESAGNDVFRVRLEQPARVPLEAPVRWFDGATAWQAIAQLEQADPHCVTCRIVPPQTWEPTPRRRSTRVQLNSQVLVRIVSSSVLPSGRRVHTACRDMSETGCRATWPGRPPCIGDALSLTWDIDGSRAALELGWVAARVTRVIPQPSGASEICCEFAAPTATQAARIHAQHQIWLHNHPGDLTT